MCNREVVTKMNYIREIIRNKSVQKKKKAGSYRVPIQKEGKETLLLCGLLLKTGYLEPENKQSSTA